MNKNIRENKSNFFVDFNSNNYLKVFSEKMYSLELLVLFMDQKFYSITDLYDNIYGKKPRIDAFNKYLDRLIQCGVCTKERSKINKNEVIIKLKNQIYIDVKKLFDRHNFLKDR